MSEKLETLKKKRTGIRTQTTKLCNKIKNALEDQKISDDERFDLLNICKDQLNEKYDSLKFLNSEIQNVIPNAEFEKEIENSEEYSEKIIEWKYKITKSLNIHNAKSRNSVSLSSGSENESPSRNINERTMKLPKITLGKFYGDCSSWLDFWGQFSNAIDKNSSLTPIDKFSYLKSLLGASAANAVAGFSLTEENYKSAVDLLKNRFGRNDLVINAHMSKLLNLKPVRNATNVTDLRNLYDSCEIQIRNLNSLGVASGSYGHLLCPILLKLIPAEIALEFNRKKTKDKDMDVNELISFIKEEVESREATLQINSENYVTNKSEKYKQHHTSNFKRGFPSASALTTNVKNICVFCKNSHISEKCQDLSIPEKREKLRKEGRCFVCFRKFHISAKCKFNSQRCKICNGNLHETSVCVNSIPKPRVAGSSPAESTTKEDAEPIINSVSHCESKCSNVTKEIILQTCCVNVESGLNSEIFLCLLDSGSQKSFVTKRLVSELNPPVIRQEKLQIYSFGAIKPQIKTYDVVELKLTHVQDKTRSIFIEALVTDVISSAVIQYPHLNKQIKSKLAPFELSHCNTLCSQQVDVLVGADYFYRVNFGGGFVKVTKSLFLCESLFGYSLCGAINDDQNLSKRASVLSLSVSDMEQKGLKMLWDLECLGIKSEENVSEIDKEIMSKFESNLKFVDNRYETGLLWKDEKIKVGNNFRVARNRFEELQRKLAKDKKLCENYKAIVAEQEMSGIVEECPEKSIETGYFLPHRPILREDKSTTKVRMVFDASSKENHLNSLNNCLWPGPSLNPNILDVIINFRVHNVAFCADLEKAFLQIGICEKDRDYLKFLWCSDEQGNLRFLRFTRVPFGVTCSPFILAATIKHHIRKYKDHPEVIKNLDSHLYVDDFISGSISDEEAYYLSSTASDIFRDAGMNLRKFSTNSEELRKMWVRNKLCDTQGNSNVSLKILGLLWNTDTDVLYLDSQSFPEDWKLNPTKRIVLKAMLKVFDPIGFVAPFTVRMKSLLQEIWRRGLEWDSNLPIDLKDEWESWCSEIVHLRNFEVPRKYFPQGITFSDAIQIHIFSDASPKAYGAVAYLRCDTSDDKIKTNLVWAKCRVSPIKRLTIPRLELMGAVIASRMAKYLKNALAFKRVDFRFWSDSTVTLHWIKGSALNWKPFVANRVTEIQSLTEPENWNYCSGKNNPSDLLTRGENLLKLSQNNLWFHGPEWLSMPECMWPLRKEIPFNNDVLDERKSIISSTQLSCAVSEPSEPLLKLEKFSKLKTAYSVTAWIMRFLYNSNKRNTKISGPLTASEIAKAELYWLKQTQQSVFRHEIDLLNSGKEISKDSPLCNLSSKLDENGLLILSGRLQFSEFTQTEKHPWILPSKCTFTTLIIQQAHEKLFHFGVATTLAHLRERYFIIKGRKTVKSVLKNCVICKKFNSSPGRQDIAPLPKDRIVESPPFETCAVDFAGPIYVKTKTDLEKAYIVLFTCAVTRAVHLELASDLSTSNFLLAFKRFISRRGLCKTIYSDNAKTFVKADNLLNHIWNRISKTEILQYFTQNNIVWKFIVPRASWWGGFWERMVRSVKTPLKKVLGRSCLTFEEIQTTLTEIEAVINGRPLTYVYEEGEEPMPLTPSHFLIGKRVNSLPEISYSSPKSNKLTLTKKLRYREQITNHFWKRWRKEYLLELRSANFTTPTNSPSNFKVGDVVLIHEDNVKKHLWKCGLVKELFFGRDSKVRSCELQTSSGRIKRPIQLLYKLELDFDD